MPYFFCKLSPPRRVKLSELSVDEIGVLRAHADYWLPHVNAGLTLAIGPVDDPDGVYGVMIANAPSKSWLERIQGDDPAVRSGLGFRFENFIMPALRLAPLEPLAPVNSVSP